jgi:porin
MDRTRNRTITWAVGAAVLVATQVANAQDGKDAKGIPETSIARNFLDNLDPDGRRAALADRGIVYGLTYAGEVFGVATGGIQRGARYFGQAEVAVDVDFAKLSNVPGLTFRANVQNYHGRGISATHVGVLDPVSSIEATPTTRLIDFWFERELVKDKLSLRVGQMRVDADGEFLNAPNAGLFLTTSFGWPAFMAVNLPNGGVSYPLSALGARVRWNPTETVSWSTAVFNDDPAGPCDGDPQICNRYGLNFRLRDKPFVISEVQVKSGDPKQTGSLPGLVKVGAFIDFAAFDDKRFGTDGLSLADPASNGLPRHLARNYGLYGVIDQQVYRARHPGAGDSDGVYWFARVAGLPSDRNLVSFSFDTGVRAVGLVPGRPSDEFGLAVAYNRISPRVSDVDRDAVALAGAVEPVRSGEIVAEVSYKAQLAKGWFVQPDVQYIWQPGGKAADPSNPSRAIPNAVVLGMRSTVSY